MQKEPNYMGINKTDKTSQYNLLCPTTIDYFFSVCVCKIFLKFKNFKLVNFIQLNISLHLFKFWSEIYFQIGQLGKKKLDET